MSKPGSALTWLRPNNWVPSCLINSSLLTNPKKPKLGSIPLLKMCFLICQKTMRLLLIFWSGGRSKSWAIPISRPFPNRWIPKQIVSIRFSIRQLQPQDDWVATTPTCKIFRFEPSEVSWFARPLSRATTSMSYSQRIIRKSNCVWLPPWVEIQKCKRPFKRAKIFMPVPLPRCLACHWQTWAESNEVKPKRSTLGLYMAYRLLGWATKPA